MRSWVAGAGAVASLLAGALSCADLFHSTSDVLDKCEVDPAGCFCAWDSGTALQNAQRACAWLGACETPFGRNAFGSCMIHALLAFDCEMNPDYRVRGEAHDRWACLASAASCDQVRNCVLPRASASCSPSAPAVACVKAAGGTARIACDDAGAHVENCALWGQACTPGPSPSCGAGPSRGLTCNGGGPNVGSCDPQNGTIHWCTSSGDKTIECSEYGSGSCEARDGGDGVGGWLACAADTHPPSGLPCAASLAVSCSSDGVATSCPSGVTETIDCSRLLGQPSACSDAGLDPPFDWTSPCTLDSGCPPDGCDDAGNVMSCARGAPFTAVCAKAGLGNCRLLGAQAACAPPATK